MKIRNEICILILLFWQMSTLLMGQDLLSEDEVIICINDVLDLSELLIEDVSPNGYWTDGNGDFAAWTYVPTHAGLNFERTYHVPTESGFLEDQVTIHVYGELEPPVYKFEDCSVGAIIDFTNSIVPGLNYEIVVQGEQHGQESLLIPITISNNITLGYEIVYYLTDTDPCAIFGQINVGVLEDYEPLMLEISLFSCTTDPNDPQGPGPTPQALVHVEMEGGSGSYKLLLDGRDVTDNVDDELNWLNGGLIWVEYIGDEVYQTFILQDNETDNCSSQASVIIPNYVFPPEFEEETIYTYDSDTTVQLTVFNPSSTGTYNWYLNGALVAANVVTYKAPALPACYYVSVTEQTGNQLCISDLIPICVQKGYPPDSIITDDLDNLRLLYDRFEQQILITDQDFAPIDDNNFMITIYQIDGKIIRSKSNVRTLSTNHIKPGMYVVEAKTERRRFQLPVFVD